jgi:hypothetical protein
VQYVPTTINGLTKKGGRYYALTDKGVFQSTDGVSFSAVRSMYNATVVALTYSGSEWLLVGNAVSGGAQPFYKSTDGTTWVKVSEFGTLANTSTTVSAPSDLTYAAGKFVVGQAVTAAQNVIFPVYTSADGVTWTGAQTPYMGKPTSFASDGTTIVYADISNNMLVKSTDGGSSWLSFATNSGISGSATMQYTNGAWFLSGIFVSTNLQNFISSSTSNTPFYSDGQYAITFGRSKVFCSVTAPSSVASVVPGSLYVPPSISNAVLPETPVRGTTALVPVQRSESLFPYLIAEYPLYSYDTSTTFFIPSPVAGNNGSTSYMYAGA